MKVRKAVNSTGSASLKRQERRQGRKVHLALTPANDDELKQVRKALGDEIPDGYIAGWASTMDLDSYRDVVVPGAFDASIKARGLTGPKGIKLLLNHNWTQLAGVIKVLETRQGKLWIEAQLNLDVEYVEDMYSNIKMIGGLSFSVGFFLQEYNIRQDEQNRDYFELVKGDLFEVSVVPFPANSEAVMEFVKSSELDMKDLADGLGDDDDDDDEEDEEDFVEPTTIAEFEKMLVNNGLVKSRNDARLITLEVKQGVHLFVTKEMSAPAGKQGTSHEAKAPAAESAVQKALKVLSEMKGILPKTEA